MKVKKNPYFIYEQYSQITTKKKLNQPSISARDLSDDAEIVIVPKGQQGVPARTEDSDSDEDFFKSPQFPSGFPFVPQSSFGFNIGFSDSFSGKS